MAERLLTVDDVAALLSVSRSTIYRLIARDELRTTRIAQRLRVPESAVDQLIQEGRPHADDAGSRTDGDGRAPDRRR